MSIYPRFAALFLALSMGCAGSAASPGAAPMTNTPILDKIAEIAQSRPFQADAVGQAAGMTLREVSAESNDWFRIYRSTGAGALFASLEVRAPTAQSAGKGGMVIAQVAGTCVREAEVGDRFGAPEPGPPTMPSPHAPPDSPRYTVYRTSWGAIKLGYKPSTGCLDTAVLDGN